MDPIAIAIYGTGGVATLAAIVATVANRFTRIPASLLALAGGLCPWLFFAMWNGLFKGTIPHYVVGMFGSGIFFFIALPLYGMGGKTRARGVSSMACFMGTCSGIAYGILLSTQLMRII